MFGSYQHIAAAPTSLQKKAGLWTAKGAGKMGMRMPRALKMTRRKMASDIKTPRQKVAHFCSAKLCHPKFRSASSTPLGYLMNPAPDAD